MEIDKKRILTIGGVIVVGLALIVALIYVLKNSAKGPSGEEAGADSEGLPVSETRSEAPSDAVVPGLGEEVQDGTIAVPVGVTDAAPGVTAKLRTFNIKAEGGVFVPSTVIANKGDTIHINFTAVDGNYDMTLPDYGMKQTAKKGETKVFEFQAVNDGQYTYYCESCGGISSKTKGLIIIKP